MEEEQENSGLGLTPQRQRKHIYVSRKGGRGFAGIQDSIDVSIQRLETCMKKQWGGLIRATRNNADNKNTKSA